MRHILSISCHFHTVSKALAIWLIPRVAQQAPGIVKGSVNQTTAKIVVCQNDDVEGRRKLFTGLLYELCNEFASWNEFLWASVARSSWSVAIWKPSTTSILILSRSFQYFCLWSLVLTFSHKITPLMLLPSLHLKVCTFTPCCQRLAHTATAECLWVRRYLCRHAFERRMTSMNVCVSFGVCKTNTSRSTCSSTALADDSCGTSDVTIICYGGWCQVYASDVSLVNFRASTSIIT